MTNEPIQNRLKIYAVVAEIIGGVAVLVTLVFLVLEIRESTRATRAQTAQALWDQMIELSVTIGEDERARNIWFNLMESGLSSFEGVDRQGAMNIFTRNMYIYDNAVYQFNQGTLDEDVFSRYRAAILDRVNRDWFPGYWKESELLFSLSFRKYIDELLADRKIF